MEGKRTTRITTSLALEFATEASQLDPRTKAHRLSVVRGFARHLAATDPTIEDSPIRIVARRLQTSAPLLVFRRRNSSGCWQALKRTLRGIGSLVCSGNASRLRPFTASLGSWRLRACAWAKHSSFVRKTWIGTPECSPSITVSSGKSRLVPLHPATVKALATFVRHRDRFFAQLPSPPRLAHLFVTSRGTPIPVTQVNRVFLTISRQIGLRAPNAWSGSPFARFAPPICRRDVAAVVSPGRTTRPVCCRSWRHISSHHVSGTYWYLSSTPELMQAAGRRLERRWKGIQ